MHREKVIEESRKLGIADERKIRNMEILEEFIELRNQFTNYEEAIDILAYKFYLSQSSIQKIVIGYKKHK